MTQYNSHAKVRRTDMLITPCKHSATRGKMTLPHVKNSVGVQLLAIVVVLLRSTRIECTFFDPVLRYAYAGLSTLNAFGVLPTQNKYIIIEKT